LTHSLKASDFNPWTLHVISWFQAFAFTRVNLRRYVMEEETSRAMFAAAVKWLMPKTRAVADNSRRR
jgi:hypothetical protein